MPRPKHTGLPFVEEERLRNNRLLDVAAQVFLEQGYEAASTAEMAKRASASKQTFYARFPSKEALFLAVIDYRTSMLPEQFSVLFQKNGPVRPALLEAARALLSSILSKEHIALLRIVYMEAERFPEAAKLIVERGPDGGTRALADYLSLQSAAGHLRVENPLVAARHFAGLVVGDRVHRALLGLTHIKGRKALQTVAAAGVDAFFRIYGPSSSAG